VRKMIRNVVRKRDGGWRRAWIIFVAVALAAIGCFRGLWRILASAVTMMIGLRLGGGLP
jgi:hypothetical protein